MSLQKDRGSICDDDTVGLKRGAWKPWLMFSEMRYREQAATSDVIEARMRSLQLKVLVGERWWLKLQLGGEIMVVCLQAYLIEHSTQ
jgi:hypothetical protein